MREKIKETVSFLKKLYCMVMVTNFIGLMFLCGFLFPIETIPGYENYTSECICILMTLVCIPLGLWLFKFKFVKKIKEKPLEEALENYKRMSTHRLQILSLPLYFAVGFYLVTTSNKTFLFCACMAFIANFFCVPSEERMKNELDLPEEIN